MNSASPRCPAGHSRCATLWLEGAREEVVGAAYLVPNQALMVNDCETGLSPWKSLHYPRLGQQRRLS